MLVHNLLKLTAVFALSSALVACSGGGSSGGGNNKAFGTAEQREKALQTLGNSASLINGAQKLSGSKDSTASSVLQAVSAKLSDAGSLSSNRLSDDEIERRLSDAVENGDCQLQVEGEDPRGSSDLSKVSSSSERLNFKLKLTGVQCPILLDLALTGSFNGDSNGSQMNMDFDVTIKLDVNDVELARDAEIKKLTMITKMTMDMRSANQQPNSMNMSATARLQVVDLNNESVDFNLTTRAGFNNVAQSPKGTLNLNIAIAGPDFRSEARADINVNGENTTARYIIDGQTATEEEFAAWLEALEKLGLGLGGDNEEGNDGGSTIPTKPGPNDPSVPSFQDCVLHVKERTPSWNSSQVNHVCAAAASRVCVMGAVEHIRDQFPPEEYLEFCKPQ